MANIRAPQQHLGVTVANALAGLVAGKRQEDDRQREIDINDQLRQLQTRQVENSERQTQLSLDQFTEQKKERDRILSEQQREKGDLIGRIIQLDPSIPPSQLDDLTSDSLRNQLGTLEHRRTAIRQAEAQHRLGQQDKLVQLRRMQQTAKDGLNELDDEIKQYRSQLFMNPNAAAEYQQLRKTWKAGDRDPAEIAIIKHLANGRDVFAERNAAAQQVQMIRQQMFSETGVNDPLDKNTAAKMPFHLLPPEDQAGLVQTIQQRLAAGQPIDIQALKHQQVPIDQIAAQSGFAIDPATNQVVKLDAAAGAAAPAPNVSQSLGTIHSAAMKGVSAPQPGLDLNALLTGAGASGTPGMMPAAAAQSAVNANRPTAPTPAPTTTVTGNAPTTMPAAPLSRSTPSTAGTVVNPAGPMNSASFPGTPYRPQSAMLNPLGASPNPINVRGMQPQMRSASFPVGSLGQQPTIGPQQPQTGGIPTVDQGSSIAGAGMDMLAQQLQSAARSAQLAQLQYLPDLGQTESAARQLLTSGVPYEAVIQNLPERFKPLLSAKLPKRIAGQ